MKKNALILAALLVTPSSFAAEPKAAVPPAAEAVKGVRSELTFWIKDAEGKLNELAEATGEGKYGWKPSKDSRTTGEVFMHVAAANFGIPSFFGIKPPAGFAFETYEKSLTKKADIQKALKDSFAHLFQAFEKLSDADLEKPIDLFGNKTTVRGGYVMLLAHAHEHLGQSIVHARSNDIVPPWTTRYEKMAKEKKAAEAPKK